MADIGQVTNGAELVRRLAATGTGAEKLSLARSFLAFVNRKEKRVASSAEVIKALEHGGAPELTIEKAKQIAEFGEWVGAVKEDTVSVEDILLSGGAVPDDTRPAAEQALEAFAFKTGKIDAAELKSVAKSAKDAARDAKTPDEVAAAKAAEVKDKSQPADAKPHDKSIDKPTDRPGTHPVVGPKAPDKPGPHPVDKPHDKPGHPPENPGHPPEKPPVVV